MKKIKFFIILALILIIPKISYSITSTELVNDINKELKIQQLKEIYNNEDIEAIIEIPGTNIYEPVLKATNNAFYLNHNNSKEKNIIGSIFMDYRTNLESQKILIYGHNSTIYNPPFRQLENYYNQEFYHSHKLINLITDYNIIHYLIFSVFIEYKDWSYMNLNLSDENYLNHLIALQKKSWYQTNIELTKNDQILIIQTCSYHKNYSQYKDKYLLLIAKKIN